MPRAGGGTADAHGSGPCVREDVRVQIPPRPRAAGQACSLIFDQLPMGRGICPGGRPPGTPRCGGTTPRTPRTRAGLGASRAPRPSKTSHLASPACLPYPAFLSHAPAPPAPSTSCIALTSHPSPPAPQPSRTRALPHPSAPAPERSRTRAVPHPSSPARQHSCTSGISPNLRRLSNLTRIAVRGPGGHSEPQRGALTAAGATARAPRCCVRWAELAIRAAEWGACRNFQRWRSSRSNCASARSGG